MRATLYNVICLMCGFQVGHLAGRQFQPSHECVPDGRLIDLRRLRCCHCGGTVYLEAAEQPPRGALLAETP